ncbi:hypothetical protein D5282_03965 [bacterium 1xD8-48]|nr:hypothetical protein [bacterium 1xD8-48]
MPFEYPFKAQGYGRISNVFSDKNRITEFEEKSRKKTVKNYYKSINCCRRAAGIKVRAKETLPARTHSGPIKAASKRS